MKIYNIISTPQLYVEMNESILWYNSHVENLSNHFLKQISISTEFLSRFPHITFIRYAPYIRCCIISQFPYMIHYPVNLATQSIYIFAILHMRRRSLKEVRTKS